jgi:hypothetical protein
MKQHSARLKCLTLLLLSSFACSNRAIQSKIPTTPVPEAVHRGVEAQHWFEQYISALPPSEQNLTFQEKYDRPFFAVGITDPVDAIYAHLRQVLSVSDNAKLESWSFSYGACSTSGPRLLLLKEPNRAQDGGHLCIASVVLTSLFLTKCGANSV